MEKTALALAEAQKEIVQVDFTLFPCVLGIPTRGNLYFPCAHDPCIVTVYEVSTVGPWIHLHEYNYEYYEYCRQEQGAQSIANAVLLPYVQVVGHSAHSWLQGKRELSDVVCVLRVNK